MPQPMRVGKSASFFLVTGMLFLALIWGMYSFDSGARLLACWVDKTEGIPKMISSHLLLLSSSLSLFIKSAPLFSLLFCLKERVALMKSAKKATTKELVKVFFSGLLLFSGMTYWIVFLNFDIAYEGRKILSLISFNEFFVFCLYSILFINYYIFSIVSFCMMVILPISNYKMLRR